MAYHRYSCVLKIGGWQLLPHALGRIKSSLHFVFLRCRLLLKVLAKAITCQNVCFSDSVKLRGVP